MEHKKSTWKSRTVLLALSTAVIFLLFAFAYSVILIPFREEQEAYEIAGVLRVAVNDLYEKHDTDVMNQNQFVVVLCGILKKHDLVRDGIVVASLRESWAVPDPVGNPDGNLLIAMRAPEGARFGPWYGLRGGSWLRMRTSESEIQAAGLVPSLALCKDR